LDRAIDIKRRAQRSIQSGDLDGALAEYEKLVAADDSDPYNFVLLADLFYKKGDHENAAKRYLTAASCYEKAGLYKNAIAVGKKMMRLALSPAAVLDRLASLHALDGLATEATLYYTQFAELMVRESKLQEAIAALRKAFDCCMENIKALERLSEVYALADDVPASARALAEAAFYHRRAGQDLDAERCRTHAEKIQPGAVAAFEAQAPPPPSPGARASGSAVASRAPTQRPGAAPEPGVRMSGPPPLPATGERVSVGADSPELETDRPPRFVPPTEDRLPPLELDRHSHAASEIPTFAAASPPAQGEETVAAPESVNGEGAAHAPPADLEAVEALLGLAQTEFRAGHRERAAEILVRAAQAYETFDRLDNAASIYRSLCKGPHATAEMMEFWLRNCERRDDRREAAQVACELGDRAIQVNDLDQARAWFERAIQFDQNSQVARRRLDRLRPAAAATTSAPPAAEVGAATVAPETGEGKIQVAVDRGQAVTFDFASMLAEFQRGVEVQLSGDAQAHYDLAMAYREMGLSQQAIEAFRLAAKDVSFKARAAEMIGHCLLADGHFEEAAHELAEALSDSALEPALAVGMRFQLGLALEAAGRSHEALVEFEQLFEIQPSYPDVAQKIRTLRRSLEAA
jgi:tetratricopeptide (TPR) repeat protein